jgi:hypothetical protein
LTSGKDSKKSESFSIDSVNDDNIDISLPKIPITIEIYVNVNENDGFLSKYIKLDLMRKLDGDKTLMGSVKI